MGSCDVTTTRVIAPYLAFALCGFAVAPLACDGNDDNDEPTPCLTSADCGEDEVCEVKALDEQGECVSTEDSSVDTDDGADDPSPDLPPPN